MSTKPFVRELELPHDPGTVFQWHVRPGAFERLVPPWEGVRLVGRAAPVRAGAKQTISFPLGPFRGRWESEITSVTEDREFRDIQLGGPFAKWEHTHSMTPREGGSTLTDHVEYALPMGALGSLFAGRFVRKKLERMFAFRHRVTEDDLARHAAAKSEPLDVLVTGSSGMVGTALCSFLTTGGHRVRRLVRRAPKGPDEFRWNPSEDELDPRAVEGVDAVVHLAGENIAARRWTRAQKDRIKRSRQAGTRLVVEAVRAANPKPATFVSASAIGIYGSRGDEVLTEDSAEGSGFLAEVCQVWEREPRRLANVRSAQLRFGVVLSPAGGALAKMLLPFRLGAGGRVGSGSQWMSWIALDDVVAAIHHAIVTPDLAGPVNTVAPNPVTNADYTRVLGKVLRRPTVLPMPAFAAKAAFGELAEELLLASQRVAPTRLEASGFRFAYPELEGALRHQLGR